MWWCSALHCVDLWNQLNSLPPQQGWTLSGHWLVHQGSAFQRWESSQTPLEVVAAPARLFSAGKVAVTYLPEWKQIKIYSRSHPAAFMSVSVFMYVCALCMPCWHWFCCVDKIYKIIWNCSLKFQWQLSYLFERLHILSYAPVAWHRLMIQQLYCLHLMEKVIKHKIYEVFNNSLSSLSCLLRIGLVSVYMALLLLQHEIIHSSFKLKF